MQHSTDKDGAAEEDRDGDGDGDAAAAAAGPGPAVAVAATTGAGGGGGGPEPTLLAIDMCVWDQSVERATLEGRRGKGGGGDRKIYRRIGVVFEGSSRARG